MEAHHWLVPRKLIYNNQSSSLRDAVVDILMRKGLPAEIAGRIYGLVQDEFDGRIRYFDHIHLRTMKFKKIIDPLTAD